MDPLFIKAKAVRGGKGKEEKRLFWPDDISIYVFLNHFLYLFFFFLTQFLFETRVPLLIYAISQSASNFERVKWLQLIFTVLASGPL